MEKKKISKQLKSYHKLKEKYKQKRHLQYLKRKNKILEGGIVCSSK